MLSLLITWQATLRGIVKSWRQLPSRLSGVPHFTRKDRQACKYQQSILGWDVARHTRTHHEDGEWDSDADEGEAGDANAEHETDEAPTAVQRASGKGSSDPLLQHPALASHAKQGMPALVIRTAYRT